MLPPQLTKKNPDYLVTACPLCKKTLAPASKSKVADISEIVAEAIVISDRHKKKFSASFKKTVRESVPWLDRIKAITVCLQVINFSNC